MPGTGTSGHAPRINEMNTERISCGEVREKLPLYVGGDLDSDVLEAVRGHLDRCGECARRAASDQRARRELLAALRAEGGPLEPSGLWPALRATLRQEGLIHEAREPLALPAAPARPRSRRWSWAMVPVAAAAALLLATDLGGILGGWRGGSVGGGTPPIAEHPLGNDLGSSLVLTTPVDLPVQPAGGLRRIEPGEVQGLRPFQRPVQPGFASGDASLAGYQGVR